ncbi:MAG: DUF1150 family protein [Rhodospirillales bacterium]
MRNYRQNSDIPSPINRSRCLTQNDFAALGIGDIAYIKAALVDGEEGFAIHSADGEALGFVIDRNVADAAARQHDLEPLSVH